MKEVKVTLTKEAKGFFDQLETRILSSSKKHKEKQERWNVI
jgi:hypothetical protein